MVGVWWVYRLLVAYVPVYPLCLQVRISDFYFEPTSVQKDNFITRSGTGSKHSTKSDETRWMNIDYLTSVD